MAPEESTEVVLVRLDGRLSVVEESIRDMRSEMRGGFAGLQFVSREVYASEKKSVDDYAIETRKIAEGARATAEAARTFGWATAGFVVTVAGLMLALIKFVAG